MQSQSHEAMLGTDVLCVLQALKDFSVVPDGLASAPASVPSDFWRTVSRISNSRFEVPSCWLMSLQRHLHSTQKNNGVVWTCIGGGLNLAPQSAVWRGKMLYFMGENVTLEKSIRTNSRQLRCLKQEKNKSIKLQLVMGRLAASSPRCKRRGTGTGK